MGLDIYVGSLTRYYSQDWETVAEQAAKAMGAEYKQVRPEPDDEDAITDPDEIREAVTMWREAVSDALEEHLDEPLDWNEAADAPYFTDQPTWDGWGALMLWAAYSEHDDMECPTECVEEWSDDEAFLRSIDDESNTNYGTLLRQVSIWLPSDFDVLFVSEDLAGEEVAFASSVQLLAQLFDLNANTWKADEATIASWAKDCPEEGAPLEAGAKYAFAIVLDLARKATQNKLVMKLDF